jgi:hypothetical protein
MASNNNSLLLPPLAAGTNVPGDLDIRPLKGPVEIPGTYEWLWWLVAGIAIAALAWFLWRKFRFRKPAPAKPAVVIPPHQKAKARLRSASELMSDPYRFCSLVSDVLRTYVEDRFEIRAPERTTEEFMAELRTTTKLHLHHKSLLEDFLSRCDLVKFARFEPSLPELEALLDSAIRFIDETAPHSEEQAPPSIQSQERAA